MEPKIWLPIAISLAALLVSAGGPALTALIQTKHEQRMHRDRFILEHSHQVIENYLKAAGRYAFGYQPEDKNSFGESCAEIFMYAPEQLWDDIQEINILIHKIIDGKPEFIQIVEMRIELRKKYLNLCRDFAPYRRTSENKRKRRRHKSK